MLLLSESSEYMLSDSVSLFEGDLVHFIVITFESLVDKDININIRTINIY
jgi:hypothetical protein